MAHVITEKCLGERYGSCVAVCPVDCIHPGEYKGEVFMIIDPETCIDCGACIPECPINAIVGSVDEDQAYAQVNAELTPSFKENPKVEERPKNDPPKKPGNKLVN
ncbi:MAG: ferredoxin [Candidatus Omnitrophica bacterium CG11_big_fil_rev_8_21_14_0_20_45_26]|uniref:Ferredoxin n=1 Tax=Candidatus Abzuiibacterium crystallinum TaxID=1974748 RepID=A0A2H0LSW4_9BACT|nr:MAG: ferredoxin [Candidatus Omnitrophica bacterium CG11_big_fil_rev_8_21_14_0_20_45_26]PIW65616.1 MAG: ferredoxin [Candidatus Omnitrophica bacterium CG12_big_fil_rev_8_21_14_0_65_45_16]